MDSEKDDRLPIGRVEDSHLPLLNLKVDLPQARQFFAEGLDAVARGRGSMFAHCLKEHIDDLSGFVAFRIDLARVDSARPLQHIIGHQISQLCYFRKATLDLKVA